MGFHWSLSDSKSPQVYTTLLSILDVLSNAVTCIVSTRPSAFMSARPFNNPLVIGPKAPITIGTIVNYVPQFFQFPSMVEVLIFLFTFFQFYSVVSRDSKVDNLANSLVFVNYYKVWSSGRDWGSVCMTKSHWSLCVSFSRSDAGLCIYHLFVWSNFNFLHISQWITLLLLLLLFNPDFLPLQHR